MDCWDLVIVGGGPTGLFGAFYAGLRGMRTLVLDSLPALGGRLTAIYPEKHIYDVPGFPKILARDLVKELAAQAMVPGVHVALGETAEGLSRHGDTWHLMTSSQTLRTKCVLIAAGVGAFSCRKHPAPTSGAFEGKGLEYAVLSKRQYAGKKVVVLGGGDSALDWALELHAVGADVTLLHRTTRLRAHEATVSALQASGVRMCLGAEAGVFHGAERLERIDVQWVGGTHPPETWDVDAALVFFGYQSSLGKLRDWGLHLGETGILVGPGMDTNLPGVYAAGDIAEHASKITLIATGFAEAATAVNFAKTRVTPGERAQPGHSTSLAGTPAAP